MSKLPKTNWTFPQASLNYSLIFLVKIVKHILIHFEAISCIFALKAKVINNFY